MIMFYCNLENCEVESPAAPYCHSKEATGIEVSASSSLSRKTRQRPRAILLSFVPIASERGLGMIVPAAES